MGVVRVSDLVAKDLSPNSCLNLQGPDLSSTMGFSF